MTQSIEGRAAVRLERANALLRDSGLQAEAEALRITALARRLASGDEPYFDAGRLARNLVLFNRAVRSAARYGPRSPLLQDSARRLAGIAEQLAEVEPSGASTTRMVAAVAWEIAGFQANAATLARKSATLPDDEANWSTNSFGSAFLQRKFLRLRRAALAVAIQPVAASAARADRTNPFVPEEIVDAGGRALFAQGLLAAAEFMLTGDRDRLVAASGDLELAQETLSSIGHSPAANLADGFLALLPRLDAASTWTQLAGQLPGNRLWLRYLAVLARGVGGDTVLAARSISELWPSQQAAVAAGLFDHARAHVVRMPTSAGKTRVAEMAIVHSFASNNQSRCLYVAPFNALASEVENSFSTVFDDLGLGVSTLAGAFDSGDLDDQLSAGDDLLVLTPEKLDQLLRQAPESLDTIGLVVLDEGHLVGELGRGPKYELVMTRLRRRLPNVSFLVLSAVVPDQTLRDFSAWLGRSDHQALTSTWRPTVLRVARLDWFGSYGDLVYPAERSIAQLSTTNSGEPIVDVPAGLTVPHVISTATYEHVNPATRRKRRPKFPESDHRAQVCAAFTWQVVADGPVLVFCMLPAYTTSVAKALMTRITFAELREESFPPQFRRKDTRSSIVATEWLGEEHEVTLLLSRGIGVHYANLPSAVRSAVEDDFRDGQLAVLAATSTLAQGVNLPVKTVVVHSTKRYDPDTGQVIQMPARDFWNIAGRVGRAGNETEGTVVFLAMTQEDRRDFDFFQQHSNVNVEPVTSALLEQLRQLVQNRISQTELAQRLDPEMLALLVEEEDHALTVEGLRELLGESLFEVQGNDRDQIPVLYSTMAATTNAIASGIEDVEQRRLYASTGLAAVSCVLIEQHVALHSDELAAIVEDMLATENAGNYLENRSSALIELAIEGLSPVREMQSPAGFSGSHIELLNEWILGTPVAELASTFETDPVSLSRFIEQYFGYSLPWGLAGYTRIALSKLGFDSNNEVFSTLPSMVRFGVPNSIAAWAMALGIPSRPLAAQLGASFIMEDETRTPGNFRKWLRNLDAEQLSEQFGVSGLALDQTARVIRKAQGNDHLRRYYAGESDLLPLQGDCFTLRWARTRGFLAGLQVGSQLNLVRDYDSTLNRTAVELRRGGTLVARLPRSMSQVVAVLLDTGSQLVCSIVDIVAQDDRLNPLALRIEIRFPTS